MAPKGFFEFIKDQLSGAAALERADLTGKTVMVIGGDTGLGYETAHHLSTMNPKRIILACRPEAKGDELLRKVKKQTNVELEAELWAVELDKFDSVRMFAFNFAHEGGRLDTLIVNANHIPGQEYKVTQDGWERTLQVNYLSPALLSILLLPCMYHTAHKYNTVPRLVIASSDVHFWVQLDKEVMGSAHMLNKLNDPNYCTQSPTVMQSRYHTSKLLTVLFVRELSKYLPRGGSAIIAAAVNPGFCRSDRPNDHQTCAMWFMEHVIARTAVEGGKQLVFGAVGQSGEQDLSGTYISNSRVVEPSDFILSDNGRMAQQRIWDETLQIVVQVDPNVEQAVKDCFVNFPVTCRTT